MVAITILCVDADDKTINTHEKLSNSFYLFFISGQIIKSYKKIVLRRRENNSRFICISLSSLEQEASVQAMMMMLMMEVEKIPRKFSNENIVEESLWILDGDASDKHIEGFTLTYNSREILITDDNSQGNQRMVKRKLI